MDDANWLQKAIIIVLLIIGYIFGLAFTLILFVWGFVQYLAAGFLIYFAIRWLVG